MTKFNIAFVYDHTLNQEYINLTKYHLKNDFWNTLKGTHNKHKKRNDGMTRYGLIGKTGMIYFRSFLAIFTLDIHTIWLILQVLGK